MIDVLKTWIELKTDKRAVTALEYALIAAVIAAVMVTGATTIGTNINTKFASIASTI